MSKLKVVLAAVIVAAFAASTIPTASAAALSSTGQTAVKLSHTKPHKHKHKHKKHHHKKATLSHASLKV